MSVLYKKCPECGNKKLSIVHSGYTSGDRYSFAYECDSCKHEWYKHFHLMPMGE